MSKNKCYYCESSYKEFGFSSTRECEYEYKNGKAVLVASNDDGLKCANCYNYIEDDIEIVDNVEKAIKIKDSELQGVVKDIIDCFEEVLEAHNIVVPDGHREGSETYCHLEDSIKGLLNLLKEK